MTKLIPLEEVLKSTESGVYPSDDEIRIRKKILSLPTIDPIATIDSFYKEVESSENSEMLLELKKRFYGFL